MRREQRRRIQSKAARTDRAWRPWLWLLTTGWLVLALPACGGGGDDSGSSQGSTSSAAELSVESLTFSPSQVNVGDTVHVVDVVRNSGNQASGSFQVDIYVSADASITSADVLIGQRSIASLGADQTSIGGGFLTIPNTVGEGLWFIGAIVDPAGNVTEANEVDNIEVALQNLQVSVLPPADLRVTHVSVTATTVEAGQTLAVSETVENIGVGAASSFQIGVYLSQDSNITPADELLGVRSVASLGPGEISFLASTLTVPASVPAGTWFVGAMADIGGTQFESDEFNNAGLAGQTLQVTQPPRPDLKMNSLLFTPNVVDAGQNVTFSESIVNQGLASASPFRIGIYLSEDDTLTTDDHLVGFRSLGGLAIGEGSSVSAPLVIPASVGGGDFHVGAIADHEQSIVESDEGNNGILALGTIEVRVPPMPNLETVAVSFSPNAVLTGETISVVERIKNSGVIAANNVRVGVYLSSNDVVTTSDVSLGFRVIANLPVGATDEALTQFTLPPGLSTGSYTLGVIADDLNGILEPDEGDNLRVAPGLLDITGTPEPLADLLVESLSVSPLTVSRGSPLTVQSLVRNEGDLSSSQFQVRFYLSTDATIEATDHLVGVRTIFQLGIDNASAQSFPYTLDAAMPVGTYHFGALCDDPSVILESDEDNNAYVFPTTVEVYIPPPPAPDLVIDALSFDPATIALGGQLQLNDTVRNGGTLESGSFRVDYYASTDAEVDASDIWIGSGLTTPSLGIGETAPASSQVELPVEVVEGTWHVGAIVSLLSGTAENQTENNTRVATSTLEVTQ